MQMKDDGLGECTFQPNMSTSNLIYTSQIQTGVRKSPKDFYEYSK